MVKNFGGAGGKYPGNVARLIRNLVWKKKARIERKQDPPFKEPLGCAVCLLTSVDAGGRRGDV